MGLHRIHSQSAFSGIPDSRGHLPAELCQVQVHMGGAFLVIHGQGRGEEIRSDPEGLSPAAGEQGDGGSVRLPIPALRLHVSKRPFPVNVMLLAVLWFLLVTLLFKMPPNVVLPGTRKHKRPLGKLSSGMS